MVNSISLGDFLHYRTTLQHDATLTKFRRPISRPTTLFINYLHRNTTSLPYSTQKLEISLISPFFRAKSLLIFVFLSSKADFAEFSDLEMAW